MSKKPKPPTQKEMTQEELENYFAALEEFEDAFYENLAGTKRLQIVPLVDEDGEYLTKEALTAIKTECQRLGYTIVYQIDKEHEVMLYCPRTKRIGIVAEGVH